MTADGWVDVPYSEHDRLAEIAVEAKNRFPRCTILKPERDRDLYVGWSAVVEAPVITGHPARDAGRRLPGIPPGAR
jgi:hypothetical protein